MRSKRNRTPRWQTLDLILLATAGGLILEHHLDLTPTGHKLALILFIAFVYGWMGLWVKSNATALESMDAEEYRKKGRNPALYGTPAFPTRTQFHFQKTVAFYRRHSLDKRER